MNRLQEALAARNRSLALRGQGARPGLAETLLGTLGMGVGLNAGPESLRFLTAAMDRAQGGPALDPYAFPPTPQAAMRLGGRYAPRTPGLRAEALHRGDETIDLDWQNSVRNVQAYPGQRFYNLRNDDDEIVASASRQMFPAGRKQSGSAFVPHMWVREDYRKTPAMFDLYNILSRGGKTPLRATFANERLGEIFNKRMERMNPPEPKPKPPRRSLIQEMTGQSLDDFVAGAPNAGLFQVTNRDIPSVLGMAPVARPAPRRPKPAPVPHAATEARRIKFKHRSTKGREDTRRGGR